MDKIAKTILKLLTLIVFLVVGLYIYMYTTNIKLDNIKTDTRRIYDNIDK